jgi:hypothetical protein
MSEEKYYINLKKQVEFIWPQDVLKLPDLDSLSKVWLKPSTLDSNEAGDELYFNSGIVFQEAVSFDIAFIDGLSLILGTADLATEINVSITISNFSATTIPQTSIQIGQLPVTVSLDNSLFVPAEQVGSDVQPEFIPLENGQLNIDIEGVLINADLEGNLDLSFESQFSIPPVFIGQTGIVLEGGSVSMYLTKNGDAPPGFEPGFQGIYFETLNIYFTSSLSALVPEGIEMHNASIGSGGFSGHVLLDLLSEENVTGYDSSRAKDFLGFSFTLQRVELELKQNAITGSSIKGFLKLPFFDEVLEIEIGLTNDGDFTIEFSGTNNGLLHLEKDGIISIEISSLEFIKEENSFSVKLTGTVTPLLAGLAWPAFELLGLTINSDGTVQVEGGWIELPDLKALDFHGFKIEIDKLGFGSDEEDEILYKWVGFSGGIQIINELPMRGGVEGLKVMWGIDGAGELVFKLKIGGVYLSFTIEDVLTFDGAVYFIDEPDKKEFRGGVALNLIPINFGVDAQFITGKTADYNYFYIFIALDLPVGIPLGPTALGLYGFAGLYGHNMTLDYQKLIDYEGVENRPDLSDISNWYNQKGALALGAGITVGTLPDTKFTVKAKVLFVVLIPGPVLLIEGNVGILSTGDNFLMKVLAVLDVAAGTFLMNISATYAFPKNSGDLLDIAGSAEAYFSAGNPDSWHLYLGENEPESKRIRADILSFFKAQTYLMVDNNGLLMGAWIGYGLDKKYGILRVVLEAWMSGELGLSLMPIQAKGSITLYGNAELSVSMVSLGISVEANVTAEAPKPLYIEASMEVQLKTPLGKPKATIKLKWEKTGVPSYPIPLSLSLGIEHRKVTKNWGLYKSSPYAVDDDGLYIEDELPVVKPLQVPLVAPDVYLVLNFDKPVEDTNLVGINPALSPKPETVGDYDFKYSLESVLLEYRDEWDESVDDGQWSDYEAFAESQVQDGRSAFSLSGTWQIIPDTDKIVNTKLELNACTPFEISRVLQNTESWWGMVDLYHPEYPCTGTAVEEKICADFETRDFGYYYNVLVQNQFIFASPYPMNVLGYAAPWLGTERALNNGDSYQTIECLNIKAQEKTERINLKVIENVVITAGIGYDSYLKLTDEFSEGPTELFISVSMMDAGKIPAFILFPELHFQDLPYEVWITCIVEAGDNSILFALDEDGNVLDNVQINEGTNINGAMVYKLESAGLPIRKIGIIGYGIRIIEICYAKNHSVEASVILVTAPEDIVKSEIHLSKGSNGNIIMYDKENTQFENIVFDIAESLPDNEVQPVILEAGSTGTFRSFLITGQYEIIRVCSVTEDAHETYLNNAGLDTHLQTSLEENWGRHTAQILHPNKYYRLTVITTASRRKSKGEWVPQQFEEYMYFKTGNPPGPPAAMQLNSLETERYDLEEPLKDLSSYINYSIPAGAAADEAQQFIYRSYDIGVVYNDSYIDQMYQMANLPIKIRLRDNNNLPVLNAAGEELELLNLWGDNPQLSQTREEEHYQDMLDESGCIVMATTVIVESNNELIASSRDLLLSPRSQYKAQVIAGENTPIHEFTFLTSRYANFMQHIHSFADRVWNHFDLLGDADYEADTIMLEQILNNTEEEHIKFEQLMGLFDLNPRLLPERSEVMLINDKNKKHAFLLETPEPLDWDRCESSVQFANKIEPVEEFNDTRKITGGSVQVGISNIRTIVVANNQWVEMLLMESADLTDFVIDYRNLDSTEEEYVEFYRFTEGSIYNSGTLIRIYNDAVPSSTSVETEHVNLYAGQSAPTFSSAGIAVRIKDKDERVLHTRIIYNENAFTEVETTIYRNEDGSRFFIFSKSGTQPYRVLQHGVYQIKFTYKRNLGLDEPVLKRFGFSDAEETGITFSIL